MSFLVIKIKLETKTFHDADFFFASGEEDKWLTFQQFVFSPCLQGLTEFSLHTHTAAECYSSSKPSYPNLKRNHQIKNPLRVRCRNEWDSDGCEIQNKNKTWPSVHVSVWHFSLKWPCLPVCLLTPIIHQNTFLVVAIVIWSTIMPPLVSELCPIRPTIIQVLFIGKPSMYVSLTKQKQKRWVTEVCFFSFNHQTYRLADLFSVVCVVNVFIS